MGRNEIHALAYRLARYRTENATVEAWGLSARQELLWDAVIEDLHWRSSWDRSLSEWCSCWLCWEHDDRSDFSAP